MSPYVLSQQIINDITILLENTFNNMNNITIEHDRISAFHYLYGQTYVDYYINIYDELSNELSIYKYKFRLVFTRQKRKLLFFYIWCGRMWKDKFFNKLFY